VPAMTLVKRNKRVALHLPVEVRGEDASGTRFTELTHSVNVSGGGILFESHRQIPIGARLALRIELPVMLRHHFGDRDTYRARAVVCRVEQLEGRETRRVGARFLRSANPGEVL
jgi:c-di-GMP-binding flagellar brake protein YcgR